MRNLIFSRGEFAAFSFNSDGPKPVTRVCISHWGDLSPEAGAWGLNRPRQDLSKCWSPFLKKVIVRVLGPD